MPLPAMATLPVAIRDIPWPCPLWQSLPSAEFEGVLHPVFEEDEWKLIAVGGLLGMWVGIFQALFVFGDSAAQ